jgi:hypothetical protein
MRHVTYINALMLDINELTDVIYESLFDNDTQELNKAIDNLIKILKDAKKSHQSDIEDIRPV